MTIHAVFVCYCCTGLRLLSNSTEIMRGRVVLDGDIDETRPNETILQFLGRVDVHVADTFSPFFTARVDAISFIGNQEVNSRFEYPEYLENTQFE